MKSNKIKPRVVSALIGKEIIVKKSSDKQLQGLHGKIVDETLKTIVIKTKDGEKTIPKEVVVIEVLLPNGSIEISGKELLQRPHERLKKMWRKVK